MTSNATVPGRVFWWRRHTPRLAGHLDWHTCYTLASWTPTRPG